MKILVLNCGSSSIKYKLFDMTTKEVLAQGGIEKIGLVGSFLKLTLPNGEKKISGKRHPRTYRRYRVYSEHIGEPGIWRNQVIGRNQRSRSPHGTRRRTFQRISDTE